MGKIVGKEHFNLKPTHSNPQIFVMSQWQFDPDSPSIIYLFFRALIFVAFLTITILSFVLEAEGERRFWPIYLTNWGLTVCTCQSLLSFVMVAHTTVSFRLMGVPKATGVVMKIYWLYWMFHVTATTLAFIITLVYWTLIHQSELSSTMNFMVHGMNSILMSIDLFVVKHSVRLGHLIYPVGFSFFYLLFTVVYYFCGGTGSDSPYIYSILNWDAPLMTCLYVSLVLVLIFILHSLTWLMQLARSRIAMCIYCDALSQVR